MEKSREKTAEVLINSARQNPTGTISIQCSDLLFAFDSKFEPDTGGQDDGDGSTTES